MEDKRKLVTLKTIDAITPIKDADKIECAHIGGWNCVVGKGEFYEGQQVFYFETDAMLPLDKKTFEFLRPRGVKVQDGREYHRLKAMKLRGVVSDGLILPFGIINDFEADPDKQLDILNKIQERGGGDFSQLFGVIKYEDPILAKLGGKMSHFPDWITKTDEERIQNLPNLLKYIQDTNTFDDWYATEKIDGTSCTIWGRINEGKFEYGVCSRNYGLEEDDENTYWIIAKRPIIRYKDQMLSTIDYIKTKCLEENVTSMVLQGEIFGEGIQNNPLQVRGQVIRFFNCIIDGKFVSRETLKENYDELVAHWVPIHEVSLEDKMETVIGQPDGVKTLVPGANKDAQIEGFVWRNKNTHELQIPKRKSLDEIDFSKIPEDKWDLVKASLNEKTIASFKVISDKYRLKHQD